MTVEGGTPQQQQPESGGSARPALWPVVLAFAIAVVSGIVPWFLGRSLKEIEAIAGLMLLCCGLLFDIRWCVHLRLKYCWFGGKPGEEWTKEKRRRLCSLTLVNIALSIATTLAGLQYLLNPGRYWQVGVTFALLVMLTMVVEATRRVIQVGGPKCGADVIESCRPVRWFLDEERSWNGKWGMDRAVTRGSNLIPTGSRNKAAVVLVVGLVLSFLTQSGVVVGRVIKGPEKDPANNHASQNRKEKRSGSESGVRGAPTGGAAPAGDPCAAAVSPGTGAVEPVKSQIRRAWEASAPASGCAGRARLNPSGTAYIVKGTCLGRDTSLGIGSWERGAAVLLEDAAAAAESIAEHHELEGASERIDIGGGDFHLLFTSVGPYLLIRGQKTDGEGGLQGTPETCAEIEPGGQPYVVLPPGMAGLWISFSREVAASWPKWADGEFVFEGLAREKIASGTCSGPIRCRLTGSGVAIESSADSIQGVTVPAVLEVGLG